MYHKSFRFFLEGVGSETPFFLRISVANDPKNFYILDLLLPRRGKQKVQVEPLPVPAHKGVPHEFSGRL